VRGSVQILVTVGVAGACTMAIELAAVRLLAPWFGTSTAVWTNVIGVVLLALSTGYLIGGRLSSGAEPARRLAIALVVAAGCTGWLPAAARPVARIFLPAGTALDEAWELLTIGSLATALVLFLPGTLLLGCIPPLAAETLQRSNGKSVGQVGGVILAVSTLGSIVGTFVTTYLALPRWGLTWTFAIAGSLLALLGLALLWRTRRGHGAGAWFMLIPWIGAVGVGRASESEAPAGFELRAARESRYQSVRVVEGVSDGLRMRRLQVNEGLDSFQSVWQPSVGWLPAGYYYNLFALPPWWSRAGGEWRVFVLGLGGGTAWRVLEGAAPPGLRLSLHGAELDPDVVDLGRAWLDLPAGDADHTVFAGWDGRVALRHVPGEFDELILDAYANQTEIPPHLCSREFFELARDKLRPGGWLCINVGAFGLHDPVLEAIGATIADAFGQRALCLRVPFSRNCVVFARRDDEPHAPGSIAWSVAEESINARLEPLGLPGSYRWFQPSSGAVVLTDDSNDIESRQRRSLAAGLRASLGEP
jgi:spermidine synthase